MNTRPKGPTPGGDEPGRGWNETVVKSEAYRREEILVGGREVGDSRAGGRRGQSHPAE